MQRTASGHSVMLDKGGDGGPSANNSSDFVRKLYKMLEDPSYDKIVRWGEGGESFVVLETDKFTKHILPKHFKHSNFASFVRQLNKYDFHKVRQTNEDTSPSPYGPNAWEFKHPDFQANKKDALDNIKRKAPAPRKSGAGLPDEASSQQYDLVNSQLVATQQQVQHLAERNQDLVSCNTLLLNQVYQLQKFVKNHGLAIHKVLGYLQSADMERKTSRYPNGSANASPSMYHPASPLSKASALLESLSADSLPNDKLEQMSQDLRARRDFPGPSADRLGSVPLTARSESSNANMGFLGGNVDLDQMVYPVGQTNGIDPINSDHINNIPYALPDTSILNMPPAPSLPQANGLAPPQPTRARVLLVEDDLTCAKIGAKFLDFYECDCVHAVNGMDAVAKISSSPNAFHLVLMDIIMPHLDGVSATVLIRETRPDIPVIAMTSNIQAADIDVYFKHGMNDVLPKPFTKESMNRVLCKHLPPGVSKPDDASTPQPLAPPPIPQAAMAQAQRVSGPPYVTSTSGQSPLHLNMASLGPGANIKDEPSPMGKSPANSGGWTPTGQIPSASPIGPVQGGFVQAGMRDPSMYSITPTHSHNPAYPSPLSMAGGPRGPPMRRSMTDISGPGVDGTNEHPEKRQRVYQR